MDKNNHDETHAVRISSQGITVSSDKGSVRLYAQTNRGFQPVGILMDGVYHAEHGCTFKGWMERAYEAERGLAKETRYADRCERESAVNRQALVTLKRRMEGIAYGLFRSVLEQLLETEADQPVAMAQTENSFAPKPDHERAG